MLSWEWTGLIQNLPMTPKNSKIYKSPEYSQYIGIYYGKNKNTAS